MTASKRTALKPSLIMTALAFASFAGEAAAQGHSVVACRDRSGAFVTCASGGSGGGGGGGGRTHPTGGAMGTAGDGLGVGVGTPLFNMIMGKPGAGAEEAGGKGRRAAQAGRGGVARA